MNFTSDYYQTRNYANYLSRRFDALASDIKEELGLNSLTRILDFGCGYGGLVAALNDLGCTNIVGTDISQWAIEHGKEMLDRIASKLQYYNRNLLDQEHDVLLILDVLEHVPVYEIENILRLARHGCQSSMLVRIPVSADEGEPFVLPVSNNDPTHITCHTKGWWNAKFMGCGWKKCKDVVRPTIYDSPGVFVSIYH